MQHTVRFLPDEISVEAKAGENLLDVAARGGVFIPASCGGEGVCGKCKVKVVSGEVDKGAQNLISEQDRAEGYSLACKTQILSDLTVSVPVKSEATGRELKRKPKTTRAIPARSLDSLVGSWEIDPPVEKRFLIIDPPTIEDNVPDLQRLMRAIKKGCYECAEPTYDHPELLRTLPFILRQANWQVTVILLRGKRAEEPDRIIAVEAGDTTKRFYGMALDIGTTTIGGVLLDLTTGRVIAEASAYNGQIAHGEDVISRIIYSQRPGGLQTLQEKVVASINQIIATICANAAIAAHDITYIMAAGNTIMSHLLLGLDPKFIREAPYVPICNQMPLTRAAALGIDAHPSMRLFLYASVASYVGGDIVSGVHACQMHKSPALTLFIDIGTNGEIVVGNDDWMICAACSAGPAFEGGGIRYGMRASSGAIENFHIDPETLEPMIVTIDHAKPRGICGSGLISIVAELLEVGVIDQQGKFDRSRQHPRIRSGVDNYEYVLAWAQETLIGADLVITEVDLDNLIRAKGAMFAGYVTLLESVGMGFADLERVVLAGNFGAYIDLERAITIGLLPDIDRERFFYLGNASLLGAHISLTDNKRFRERTMVSSLMTNMELSESPKFMDHYMASLFLPHTAMELFPTVAQRLAERP